MPIGVEAWCWFFHIFIRLKKFILKCKENNIKIKQTMLELHNHPLIYLLCNHVNVVGDRYTKLRKNMIENK